MGMMLTFCAQNHICEFLPTEGMELAVKEVVPGSKSKQAFRFDQSDWACGFQVRNEKRILELYSRSKYALLQKKHFGNFSPKYFDWIEGCVLLSIPGPFAEYKHPLPSTVWSSIMKDLILLDLNRISVYLH